MTLDGLEWNGLMVTAVKAVGGCGFATTYYDIHLETWIGGEEEYEEEVIAWQ